MGERKWFLKGGHRSLRFPKRHMATSDFGRKKLAKSKSFIKENNFSVFRNSIGDLGTSRDLTTNPLCKKTHKVLEELLKQNGCVENIQENTPIDAAASLAKREVKPKVTL